MASYYTFSHYDYIEAEFNSKRKFANYRNLWKLKFFLNNQYVPEEIKWEKSKTDLEISGNEKPLPNSSTKEALRGEIRTNSPVVSAVNCKSKSNITEMEEGGKDGGRGRDGAGNRGREGNRLEKTEMHKGSVEQRVGFGKDKQNWKT